MHYKTDGQVVSYIFDTSCHPIHVRLYTVQVVFARLNTRSDRSYISKITPGSEVQRFEHSEMSNENNLDSEPTNMYDMTRCIDGDRLYTWDK